MNYILNKYNSKKTAYLIDLYNKNNNANLGSFTYYGYINVKLSTLINLC